MVKLELLDSKLTAQVEASNLHANNIVVDSKISASGENLSPFFTIGGVLTPDTDSNQLLLYGKNLSRERNKSFGFELDLHANLVEGALSIKRLDSSLLGLNIEGVVNGTDLDLKTKTGAINGTINVKAKELKTLLRTVGMPELAKQLLRLEICLLYTSPSPRDS